MFLFCLTLLSLHGLHNPAYSKFPLAFNLADSSSDVEVLGAQTSAQAGYALASGDINGDGFVDLIISSHGVTPLGGTRRGEYEIIWGPALGSPGSIDLSGPSPDISRIFGKSSDQPLFPALATGDFNNDGFDDIIIGLQFTASGFGRAYVIFGSSSFPDTLDLQSNPPNVITIFGVPSSGGLGAGVHACDMNGDGYDEIVVAAPYLGFGEVYVIHGADSFPSSFDMGQEPQGVTRIIDDNPLQATGVGLASRDIDKDGYDDLLIGASGAIVENQDGIVTLLYGQGTLPDTMLLSDESLRIKKVFDEYRHGRLGFRVAIGDVDGDSKQDLVLAADAADPLGCTDCGEVYVLYDANQLPDSISLGSTGVTMTRIIGSTSRTGYGRELLCEDFSNDGLADVVISGLSLSDPSSVDTTIVFYGQATPPDSVFIATDTTISKIYGADNGDNMGAAVISGDFDKNGLPDLVIGAPLSDLPGKSNAGKVHLLYGIFVPTGVLSESLVPGFMLRGNYPNPFSNTTTIEYYLQSPAAAQVTVYNVLGQHVAQILQPALVAGRQTIVWNGIDDAGRKLPSGIYFYKLEARGFSQTKKLIILR